MFYEELYVELGKLFYHVAAADGKIQQAERETLNKLIHTKWEPMEDSADEFGMDLSNLIDFSFDYEADSSSSISGLQSFEDFYKVQPDKFTPAIKKNIIDTADAIAEAYHGKSKEEKSVIEKLKNVLN